ncbi:MAG: helix-turn-helix domain-containing protein [Rikenellaceae bacterium]|jgi:y4mF family transcriptional regulator|nr:helix-turn-helix domain-containing protein [Rikenellaceae bacterium]
MEICSYIGNAVRGRRKLLKIDQKTLAELAGVGVNVITRIERGESNTSLKVLVKVLDTLGLDIRIMTKGGER